MTVEAVPRFDADGSPRLRDPRREVTTRMLLTHTAGFGYDFFNEHYRRMAEEHGQPSVITASKAALATPLLADPGERWEYGVSTDWLETLTISPRPRLRISGRAWRTHQIGPSRELSTVSRISASEAVSGWKGSRAAALLTRTSRPPNAPSICAKTPRT